jgi:hypothetical protein
MISSLEKIFCTNNYQFEAPKIVKKQRYKIVENLANFIIY